MNHIRQKLSQQLTDSTKKGKSKLKPNSSFTRILEKVDIDHILQKDINNICETVSFVEAAKLLSLSACIKVLPRDRRRSVKQEIKVIAEGVVQKTEKKHGKLNIPGPFRHLLLNI